MSQGLYVADLTKIAGADFSTTGQYLIVKKGTNAGEVALATSATAEVLLGVLQNKPKQNEAALVRILGTSKVVAGGTVAEGAYVTSNGSGQAISTVVDKNAVIGIAMEAAVVNDIFEIMIVHGYLSV